MQDDGSEEQLHEGEAGVSVVGWLENSESGTHSTGAREIIAYQVEGHESNHRWGLLQEVVSTFHRRTPHISGTWSLVHMPAKVIGWKGAKAVPRRTANIRETVMFLPCINAAGQKMPPLMIVKNKTTRSVMSFNVHEGPTDALWTNKKCLHDR